MIKNRRDFAAGVLCLGAGVAFAWAASLHEIGDAMDMGAGYFPLLLALALAAVGGGLLFKALTIESEGQGALGDSQWRVLLPVLLVMVLLGLWARGG